MACITYLPKGCGGDGEEILILNDYGIPYSALNGNKAHDATTSTNINNGHVTNGGETSNGFKKPHVEEYSPKCKAKL